MEAEMARCEVCGNDYDKAFEVAMPGGDRHVFDSFECAIHAVAPVCAHCGCKIIGHGDEADGSLYCCVHCAQAAGVSGLRDRV
jgi:anthranilate phosphoribosyltransferase